jgi:molybdate transport system regulatory protein
MDIRIKVGVVNKQGEQFIGPGLVQLLDRIRKLKSINKAAKAMGLSYKKAHNMVNRLEADLEEQILVRKRGGTERGGTEITPLGEIYMAEFKRLEERIKKRAADEFISFRRRILKKRKA